MLGLYVLVCLIIGAVLAFLIWRQIGSIIKVLERVKGDIDRLRAKLGDTP